MEIILNEDNFEKEVLHAQEPVLVDFYAEWCGPCKMMAPAIEQLSNEVAGKAKVCKCDVDENAVLAKEYRVMSVPTLVVFKDGRPEHTMVGMTDAEKLKELLS